MRAPAIGPLAARAMRLPLRLSPITTRVTRFHAWLINRAGGRIRRSWLFAAGQPVLALTTVGRRSGLPRTTAVACFTDGPALALAAMNLGMSNDPNWARNLEAEPQASVVIGGRQVEIVARRAQGAEEDRLWRRWLELQPSAEAFQRLAGRRIPIFVVASRDSAPNAAPG